MRVVKLTLPFSLPNSRSVLKYLCPSQRGLKFITLISTGGNVGVCSHGAISTDIAAKISIVTEKYRKIPRKKRRLRYLY